MKILELLLKEIFHRKLLFFIGVFSITLSACIATSSLMLLKAFDEQTENLLLTKQNNVKKAWCRFKDNVRKNMLELGFNLIILPDKQSISTPDKDALYLPEEYVDKLKKMKLMSINHVLPFLKQKVWWPERKRWITLYGTPGEVQIKHPETQTPMVNKINKGKVSLGKGIYESMNLKEGDTVTFMNRKFQVTECRPAESFEDDEQFRISLDEAQDLLNKGKLISGIMAINCLCADPLGIARIREATRKNLPGTKVLENKGNMVVRVEARARAAKEAEVSLLREEKTRKELRIEKENFNAGLISVVTVISAFWVGLLMWINIRQRRSEIAILKAIGWSNSRVFVLVLLKAFAMGIIGGISGVLLGLAVVKLRNYQINYDYQLMFLVASGSIFISIISSWLPALSAVTMDPASILQEDI